MYWTKSLVTLHLWCSHSLKCTLYIDFRQHVYSLLLLQCSGDACARLDLTASNMNLQQKQYCASLVAEVGCRLGFVHSSLKCCYLAILPSGTSFWPFLWNSSEQCRCITTLKFHSRWEKNPLPLPMLLASLAGSLPGWAPHKPVRPSTRRSPCTGTSCEGGLRDNWVAEAFGGRILPHSIQRWNILYKNSLLIFLFYYFTWLIC